MIRCRQPGTDLLDISITLLSSGVIQIGFVQMNNLQVRLQLEEYTIKSSFSGPPSREELLLSPRTLQPRPWIFPSAHWYTRPQVMKISAYGPIHPPLMAPLSLTTAALLSLLLAGFTLMALLAYTSPLPSPATLYNGHTKNSGENISAMAVPQSIPALNTHSASAPGPLTIYTDPGIVSTKNREHPSNSTHSDVDS